MSGVRRKRYKNPQVREAILGLEFKTPREGCTGRKMLKKIKLKNLSYGCVGKQSWPIVGHLSNSTTV